MRKNTLSPRERAATRPIEFVSFHVAVGDGESVHPNKTVAHREYLGMIDMMFASARIFHGGARRVLLTDCATSFGATSRRVDVIRRSDMDRSQMMLERARAQLRHVRRAGLRRPMVILDSDILLNGSLAPVLERDFDVAVTWRADNEAQPINGGFLILGNRRPDVAQEFFENYVRVFEDRYAGQAAWFGDQLALRDCIGLDVDQLARHEIVDVEGCRVLLLPCDTYNFSPANDFREIETPMLDKLVLHFKGERKRLMKPFWEARLRPRFSWAPWVQERARREREWLRQQVQAASEAVPTEAQA